MTPICSHKNCQRKTVANGLCDTHYRQKKTHGKTWDIGCPPPKKKEICAEEGCENNAKANGMCAYHYYKAWKIKNRERVNFLSRARYRASPEKYKQRTKRWREENAHTARNNFKKWLDGNKEYNRMRVAVWREQNKQHRTDYARMHRRRSVNYRVSDNLRRRVNEAIKSGKKSLSTRHLVGCDISALRSHIESTWQDGMTWDNYGVHGWHIDHIKPCASYDLSDPAQQRACFHYTNLQSLWAKDNLKKSDKIGRGVGLQCTT